MTKAGGLGDWCHSGPASGKEPFARKGDQAEIWAVGVHSYMRRCQIKVQFECALKTKFLESSFQPMTLISSYQSIP